MKKGIIYALITAVLFVTLEPVSKLISAQVNPYAITFWRFMIGSFILIVPAVKKIKKDNIQLNLKDLGIMILLGILFICISMVLLQVGVQKADTPALIAIVFSSNSVFTILFAAVLVKEKLNKQKLCALILGIAGVLICADFSSGTNLLSVVLGVLAALTFSLYTVLGQKYMKKTGGIIQTSIVFLTGSIVLLIVLLASGADIIPDFTAKSIGILLYLGLLVTGVGYACYFLAIEKGGAIMASLAFFIKPVLTPFVTFFVNGIVPQPKVFAAVVCIIGASYFATYKGKFKK